MKSLHAIFSFMILSATLAVAMTAPGYQYISPKPDAQQVAPQATIIVRLQDVSPQKLTDLQAFVQVRDLAGPIAGKTHIASDGNTIIFRPNKPFSPGATVSVTLNAGAQNGVAPYAYQFQVAAQTMDVSKFIKDEDEPSAPSFSALQKTAAAAQIMPNGVSVPGDFPHINVTINEATADGYIFLNAWRDDNPYNIIFANDGSPVWYMRTNDGDRRRDFKVQKNGWITMLVRGSAGYPFGQGHVAYDENFNEVKTFRATNGYETDEHELQVLENGNYLLIGLHGVNVDMSRYVAGGQRNANLGVTAVHEYTPDGDLIFLWDAYEEIPDYLPYTQIENITGGGFRYPHMNAIDVDEDGNILVSCRHLSTVFKLNRNTGEIIWELGGPFSDFTFENDPLDGFRNQHDIRVLGNGHYTVFDNGNLHNPPRSRGVEYVLDTTNGTATLVREYRNPAGTSDSYYMGNNQRLPNGNMFIDWAVGDRPKATEVRPDGRVVYEMNFVDGYHCYRAFRFPWHGNVAKPTLMVEQALNDVQLVFNKFGDPNVVYYKIYGGQSSNATTVMDTSQKTLKLVGNLENNRRYYFRITAVYANGSESDFSNEVNVIIQKVEPGVNLVPNGDFGQNKAGWIYELQGGDADWVVEDGVTHFVIRSGGDPVYGVQLRQNQMPLIQNSRYLFEFDAWADAPRTIEAKVGQDGGGFINYSRIGLSALSRSRKHFAYEFVMQESSDPSARVVFNVGATSEDVFLDNVSLKLLLETGAAKPAEINPRDFALIGNYPNPFNAQTTIRFSLPVASKIKLELFDLLGRRQKEIANAEFFAGLHEVDFDASLFSSGVYFYRLTAADAGGAGLLSAWQKMLLIK